nr:hypothetical protein [uncultured Draconibacterium sp.]
MELKNNLLKTIITAMIISTVLCVFVFIMLKKEVVFEIENYSYWSSIIMSFAAILVTILLVFNFSFTMKIIDVSNTVENKLKNYDRIENELSMLKKQYEEIKSPTYINDLNFKNIEIKKYLQALQSKDKEEKKQAVLFFKSYGSSTYLYALKKSLIGEKDLELSSIINQAIGKLERD